MLIHFFCITFEKSINLSKWQAGTMRIKILDPIVTDQLSQSDLESFTKEVHGIVKEEVAKLDQGLGNRNA